jgi:hypothetical protein
MIISAWTLEFSINQIWVFIPPQTTPARYRFGDICFHGSRVVKGLQTAVIGQGDAGPTQEIETGLIAGKGDDIIIRDSDDPFGGPDIYLMLSDGG